MFGFCLLIFEFYRYLFLTPKRPESASEFNNLRKTIIKYYLGEYFGMMHKWKLYILSLGFIYRIKFTNATTNILL
jgi:hypothetical protein